METEERSSDFFKDKLLAGFARSLTGPSHYWTRGVAYRNLPIDRSCRKLSIFMRFIKTIH